jgi:hypothetical protein
METTLGDLVSGRAAPAGASTGKAPSATKTTALSATRTARRNQKREAFATGA